VSLVWSLTERVRFPGAGGLKTAAMASPEGGVGPAVMLVAPADPAGGSDLCSAFARRGFVAASLVPAGSGQRELESPDPDDLAGLAGFLFARRATAGNAVGVVAFDDGVGASIALVRSIPDVVRALVLFGPLAAGDLLGLPVPVQAHVQAAVEADLGDGAGAGVVELVRHQDLPRPHHLTMGANGSDEGVLTRVVDFLDRWLRPPSRPPT